MISAGDRVLSFGVEQNFEKFRVNKTLDDQIQQNSCELDKLIEKQDLAQRREPPKISIGNATQEKIPEPKSSNGSSMQVLVDVLNGEIHAAGTSKRQSQSNVDQDYVNALLGDVARAGSDGNDILQQALDANPTMKTDDPLFNFNLGLHVPQSQPAEASETQTSHQPSSTDQLLGLQQPPPISQKQFPEHDQPFPTKGQNEKEMT